MKRILALVLALTMCLSLAGLRQQRRDHADRHQPDRQHHNHSR